MRDSVNKTEASGSIKDRLAGFFAGVAFKVKTALYEFWRNIFWRNGVRPSKGKTMKRGARIFLIGMLTIPICHWFVFWVYVNINSIMMAFQLPTGAWSFHNFENLFYELGASDSQIMIALRNTTIYFCNSVLICMPCSLLLSYFFYKKVFGYKVLRVILYLPAIISSVAMTSAYSSLVAPTGPVGYIMKSMGFDPVPELLADARYATWTIVVYVTWTGIGTGTLLYQGAMARIPIEVLEASRLDGCKAGTEFFRLIIPLISPTLTTQLILTLTGLLGSSGPILLFTNGTHDTTTLSFWIFYNVKYTGALNTVAATGLFFTVVSVPVILFIRWLIEKIPTVEY